MSHKLSHTMLRGRTYYTNFRLNASNRFVRVSLGTDSQKQAEVIMNQVRPFIPLVQNGSMTIDAFKRRIQGFRAATKQDFDQYLLHWLQMGLDEAKRLPEIGRYAKEIFPERKLSRTATLEEAEGYAEYHLNQMYDGGEEAAKLLLGTLNTQHIDFEKSDLDSAYQVGSQIDENRALLYQSYQAFYSGDLPRYRQLIAAMQSQLSDAQSQQESTKQKIVTQAEHLASSNAISLSKAWEMYVEEQGKEWRKATAGENGRFYDILFYVVGDKPVDTISKQDIRDTLQVAENMPQRNKKPYSAMTLKECVEYDVPEDDLNSCSK
ncbi:hypothetical protein [Erwinia sp. V71]|uniref:hypothetical protein n=1 Tax=Erwinia sp. V71 TaxID=3369424 RepID=UPI003F62E585